METWREMLRRHFNYALGQRFDWLRRTRCQIDRCSLVSEPIGDIPEKFPSYNFQAGELKQTNRDENAAINILNKGLTAVGLTVAAYRRLSGCTPDEVGMPLSDVGKLTVYS
jgi:hypothetical protein